MTPDDPRRLAESTRIAMAMRRNVRAYEYGFIDRDVFHREQRRLARRAFRRHCVSAVARQVVSNMAGSQS